MLNALSIKHGILMPRWISHLEICLHHYPGWQIMNLSAFRQCDLYSDIHCELEKQNKVAQIANLDV